jgi:hypothetical protein
VTHELKGMGTGLSMFALAMPTDEFSNTAQRLKMVDNQSESTCIQGDSDPNQRG